MGEIFNDLSKSITMLKDYIKDITYKLVKLSNGNLNIIIDKLVDYIGDFMPIHISLEKIINNLNDSFSDIKKSPGGDYEFCEF